MDDDQWTDKNFNSPPSLEFSTLRETKETDGDTDTRLKLHNHSTLLPEHWIGLWKLGWTGQWIVYEAAYTLYVCVIWDSGYDVSVSTLFLCVTV